MTNQKTSTLRTRIIVCYAVVGIFIKSLPNNCMGGVCGPLCWILQKNQEIVPLFYPFIYRLGLVQDWGMYTHTNHSEAVSSYSRLVAEVVYDDGEILTFNFSDYSSNSSYFRNDAIVGSFEGISLFLYQDNGAPIFDSVVAWILQRNSKVKGQIPARQIRFVAKYIGVPTPSGSVQQLADSVTFERSFQPSGNEGWE